MEEGREERRKKHCSLPSSSQIAEITSVLGKDLD